MKQWDRYDELLDMYREQERYIQTQNREIDAKDRALDELRIYAQKLIDRSRDEFEENGKLKDLIKDIADELAYYKAHADAKHVSLAADLNFGIHHTGVLN